LYLDLEGRNPDDGMTDIAYEKGYHFLRLIEETVGREKFDAFLRDYFDEYAFKGMTTARFVDHLNGALLSKENVELNVDEWIYGAGIPENCPKAYSNKFELVEAEIESWENGLVAAELKTEGWSTFEWMHFVRHLPETMTDQQMGELDQAFGFIGSGNSEILFAWLMQSVKNQYQPAYPRLEAFLIEVGRRKFLQPLYEELALTEDGMDRAQRVYGEARSGYHSVSVRTMDEILNWEPDEENVF
jgi:leukotriene-A4 hydrolase